MLTKKQSFIKRIFDLVLALILTPILLPVIIILVILATIDTKKIGLFTQKRIGYQARSFAFFKIRTLKGNNHSDVFEISSNMTLFGKFLRKSRLDELPQLINVLNGSMSFVGPRPDVPGYADRLTGADRIVLTVKPGITGPATLKYRNEDEILLKQSNPKLFNDTVIWKDKVEINKEYVKNWSLKKDIGYLWQSIFS
jgi:lipopolysaccharide/colanic/teichoic acid biosynthesis glycosyltransferase